MDAPGFITLLKKGDRNAFIQLLDKYEKPVYRLSLDLTGNIHDSEEITQDTFVEVHRSISKFKGESSLFTWIYRIARNKSYEHLRRKNRKKRSANLVELKPDIDKRIEDFDHPGYSLEQKERAAILHAHISMLAENQATALSLFEFQSMSYDEIAEIMETSKSSVESLLFRARKRLKELLTEYFEKNQF